MLHFQSFNSLIPFDNNSTDKAKGLLLKGKSSEEDREDLGNVNEYMFE